jgi:23S rRNA pseudouridine1911/1915/1917 synthase
MTSNPIIVLYEDNHLIAVFKPANLLTQGDRTGDASLLDLTRDWLKTRYKKPGRVFLGLLHRLDRPVAGVVLFAKTSKGASRLSEQLRRRAVVKTYLALVEGVPRAAEATLEHYFAGDAAAGDLVLHDSPGAGRKPARLHYRLVRALPPRALVEVTLETGRKHQIRAQLAHAGHPIVGDRRHGATTSFADGIALVAKRLQFRHPITGAPVTVELPDALDPIARAIGS